MRNPSGKSRLGLRSSPSTISIVRCLSRVGVKWRLFGFDDYHFERSLPKRTAVEVRASNVPPTLPEENVRRSRTTHGGSERAKVRVSEWASEPARIVASRITYICLPGSLLNAIGKCTFAEYENRSRSRRQSSQSSINDECLTSRGTRRTRGENSVSPHVKRRGKVIRSF